MNTFKQLLAQLKEAAPVVNSFTSDLAQVRAIDLLIENAHSTQILDEEKHFPYKRKREGQPLKKLPGGTKMLSALADTDFFNEPRAIAEICHTLTAFFSGGEKKFATAEISGLLITLVKRNVLIRSKDPVSRRYVYQFPEKKNSTKADLFNHA